MAQFCMALGYLQSVFMPLILVFLHDYVRRSGSVYILGQWGQQGFRGLNESLGFLLLRKDNSGTRAQPSDSGLGKTPAPPSRMPPLGVKLAKTWIILELCVCIWLPPPLSNSSPLTLHYPVAVTQHAVGDGQGSLTLPGFLS